MKRFILSIITLFIFLIACSDNTDGILITNWQYCKTEVESNQETSCTRNWIPIEEPIIIRPGDKAEEKYRYTWLKGSFLINKNITEPMWISLGRVFHIEDVYINNIYIGKTSPEDLLHIHSPSNYSIPDGLLRQGTNTIALRLGIYGYNNGGLLSRVRIQPSDEHKWTMYFDNIIFNWLPMGLIVLFGGFFLLAFTAFLFNRNDYILLYFSLSLFTFLIHEIIIFSPISITGFDMFHATLSMITPVVAILNIMIIQSVYRKYIYSLNKLFLPIFGVCFSFAFVSISSQHYPTTVIIRFSVGIITAAISIPAYFLYIIRLHRIQPDWFRITILMLYSSIYSAALIYELVTAYSGGRYTYLIFTIIAPLFIFFFILLYSRVSMERRLELEKLYSSLRCNSASTKTHSLTDSSEEKIKSVIEFINNNHTSPLTREGLADAVEMSPNYMSNLFKSYTGKKINDYINELRIKTAAEKLKMSDTSIITIAFSTGFESLATFNRLFKRTMYETPSEYRKQKE